MNLFRRLASALRVRIGSLAALANARRATRIRLQSKPVQRVLVVCYGNIYRSAFVGELLRSRLPAVIEVRSAGFHPKIGRPSPERHVRLSKRYGVSLDQHRSALVTAADAEWADLIVLMDRHNWAALTALGVDARKLVWLGSLLPGPIEIPDPYSFDDEAAERIVARMRETTERLITALEQQGGARNW